MRNAHLPLPALLPIFPGLMLLLIVFLTPANSLAQAMPKDPTELRAARTALHPQTPEACMAYVWWNRIFWDSLWYETHVYATNGLLMETIHDDVYFQQGLQPHYRYLFEYDNQRRQTSYIQQVWGSGVYTNTHRQMWYPDFRGNDSLNFQFQWVYTPFGYAWDTLTGTRTLNAYTPNGDIASKEFYMWTTTTSGSFWSPQSKTDYRYSTAMEWDTVVFYQSVNGNWQANGRWVDITWHDYAQGQYASLVTQLPNGGWADVQRTSCSYSGLDADCHTESYSGSWDTVSRHQEFYDADSQLIQIENRVRQGNAWTVLDGRKHNYTRDSLGNVVELINQDWDQQVGYLNANKYVYSSWFVGLSDAHLPTLQVKVFPNPATTSLSFTVEGITAGPVRVALFDMQGNLRLECHHPHAAAEIKVPVSDQLPAGQYIYTLTTRAGTARGRVMLAH